MRKLWFFSILIMVFYSYMVLAETYRYATLEWAKIPNTSLYETEVKNSTTGNIQTHKTTKPIIELKLTVGDYKIRTRSYDMRGAPGSWGKERSLLIVPPDVKIKTPQKISLVSANNTEMVELDWEPIDSVQKYQITLEDLSKKDSKKILVDATPAKIELATRAKYKWSVKAVINDIEGENRDADHFIDLNGAKLKTPELEIPSDGFVESISWAEIENADKYEYSLFKKDNNQWIKYDLGKTTTEKNIILIPASVPAGTYKIQVKAISEYSITSDSAEQIFPLKVGNRSKNAFQSFLLRTSLDMPTDKYFVASYLITSIDYKSRFIATDVNFKALGGTGRLGMGFIKPKASYGLYGIADMSGFMINNEVHRFKSLEIHGFYRKKSNLQQYRVSGGIFVRDLPELSSSKAGGSQFNLVSVLGPQIGFEYWKVMTQKLGLQINARYYYSMMKLQTPGGAEIVPTSSYQLGVLGSLKLTPQIMGLAGYAFRKDQLAYKSVAGVVDNTSGIASNGTQVNSIAIQGHYLNLVLELGF